MQTAEIINDRVRQRRTFRGLILALAVLATATAAHLAEAPAASAANYGTVRVCQHIHFEGTCQTFTNFVPDMGTTSIGHDQVSSVRVEAGTRVVLWEHPNYTGRCQLLDTMTGTPTQEVSLFGSVVGNDTVSSISFGYGYHCTNPKAYVQLAGSSPYWSNPLYTDVRDLWLTATGDDATQLVYTTGLVPVAVYSNPNFDGSCVTLSGRGGVFDLSQTYVGANRASSIAINHRCEDDIQLCEHANYAGRCISITSNKPNLGDTDLGHDTASSLRVPDGWKITVYEHPYYSGLYGMVPHPFFLLAGGYGRNGGWGDMAQNFPVDGVRNDTASSIRIEGPSNCITRIDPLCVGFLATPV